MAGLGFTSCYAFLARSPSEQVRLAAGSSLARLWLLDQLVAEEEQAVVRRGFTVTWSARRRYPRSLTTEIPIAVTYDVPFLDDSGRRVDPKNLEWSHRVLGARRMTLEEFSPWTPGAGRVAFTIFPGDFETNGPHRLVLQARVRTLGLTDSWEIEPPHVPFLFEFDPILKSWTLFLPCPMRPATNCWRNQSVSSRRLLRPAKTQLTSPWAEWRCATPRASRSHFLSLATWPMRSLSRSRASWADSRQAGSGRERAGASHQGAR